VDERTVVASGRDADVYALDDRLVLRRYRDGGDVAAEAAVMRHVGRHGYPVPTVHTASGTDLVMERLHGPTMLDALIAGDVGIAHSAATLADLHHRLHAVPPHAGDSAASQGQDDDADDRAVLHLDLHPANVMLTPAGPVVIDWRNATDGPPDLDVALSALILAHVAVDPGTPMAVAASALLAAFLRQVGGDPLSMMDDAVAFRRADPNMSAAEVARVAAAAHLVASSMP
jgi:aminoglycoside phosphotransferase (APT) family kinase protein